MVRIFAFFDKFIDKELEEKLRGRGIVIKLWCLACFQRTDGLSQPYPALIDTGAHISVIPKKIWQASAVSRLTQHQVRGLIPKKECKLDVDVGEINISLCDRFKNTKEYKVLAFLAPTDEVPLILGFKDLLERFRICLDYEENIAWLEEKSNDN